MKRPFPSMNFCSRQSLTQADEGRHSIQYDFNHQRISDFKPDTNNQINTSIQQVSTHDSRQTKLNTERTITDWNFTDRL